MVNNTNFEADLTVSKGKTFKTGNFESERFDFSITMKNISDTPEEILNTLYKHKEQLIKVLDNWLAKAEEQVKGPKPVIPIPEPARTR